jgi:hypothetical protein
MQLICKALVGLAVILLLTAGKHKPMCVRPETAKFVIDHATVSFTIIDTDGELIEFTMPGQQAI